MNKMTYIIIGIIVLGVLFLLFKKEKSTSNQDDFFISTASQSDSRIANLGLDKSSEDVSYILDESQLNIPEIEKSNEEIEYKADPNTEWALELLIPNGEIIQQKKLYELFDLEWRTQFSSTIFGHSPEDGKWTYALAGGTPETYDKIQIAIDLLDTFNEEAPNFDPKKLERYVDELKKRLKKHSLQYEIIESEPKNIAIEKSKKLVELNHKFDKGILIGLQSDSHFNGREAWDVLQSLGLRWGDGDLFHWGNSSDYASDQHFSVWTSTEPGYFLPEQVKKGKMNPQNLVFGYSIPRSADPINVFEIMLNSVQYCQKRLGGKIINENGSVFNEQLEREKLEKLVKDMIHSGQIPGSNNILMLY